MPNWVECKLTVTGPESILEELVQAVEGEQEIADECSAEGDRSDEGEPSEAKVEKLRFSLGSIVPEPKAIGVYGNRSIPTPGSPKPRSGEPESEDSLQKSLAGIAEQISLERQFEYSADPPRYWDEWRCLHWGTKWDTADSELVESPPGSRVYTFLTAWDMPTPSIDVLSSLYPELQFELAAVDVGMDFAFKGKWEEGHRMDGGYVELDIDSEDFQAIHVHVTGVRFDYGGRYLVFDPPD